jgi:hypothetical protein
MIRKSFSLLALALVAAAVAAPIAQSSSTPKVDPLAVGYLIGQGLTPSQVSSWTTGACSQAVKAASCYAMLTRSATSTKPVDPLAVGYLIGQGLTPSQVSSWTTGACSHRVKAASCYAMFQSTASPKIDPLAVSYLMGQGLSPSQVRSWTVGSCSHQVKDASCYAMFPSQAASTRVVPASTRFQWGDAGIGAGFTLGIVLLGGAGAGLLISRRNGRRGTPRTA